MSYENLLAYQKSFALAMEVFEISRRFPLEECYSLTDQIRRSSRSVVVNIAEAYRKRTYPKHFASKLSDSDAENAETQTWLKFALCCKYLDQEMYRILMCKSEEIGRLIWYMQNNPSKFGVQ